MKLPTQDGSTFDWPEDWPQPTKGANASPLMGAEAFAALKADIEKNGLNDKIHFTKSGKIAKGRNRYRALRELGKTPDEIEHNYSIVAPTDDESDMLSNTLRVHRSRTSSLASFFIIFPGKMRDLVSDRKSQQKTGAGPKRSGLASEIATKLGCSPAVVTRFVDYLATLSQEQRAQEVERAAMDESFSIPPEVETPEAKNERSEFQTQLRTTNENENEKRDHRKLSEETKQAIVESLDSGASISETAREHGVSKSVVHKLKTEGLESKQQQPPEPKTTTSKPEVEILRKAFAALGASPLVFKEWAIKIHKITIAENLLRDYLDEVVESESESEKRGAEVISARQQQWQRKSAAEKRILNLEAKVRGLEALLVPLDDSQKDEVARYKRQIDQEFKRRWKLSETALTKRLMTMHNKDYALFLAGFHPDAAKEMRDKARNRFEKLYQKLVLTDADKVKWPPTADKDK